jgi:hypothetical protein
MPLARLFAARGVSVPPEKDIEGRRETKRLHGTGKSPAVDIYLIAIERLRLVFASH